MKLKHLESILQQVQGFEDPQVSLEQYLTPPHLAACVLLNAAANEDIEDKDVADLGCGTGMLGIGSQVLGAARSVGFEIDESAAAIARNNIEEFEVDMEIVMGDVLEAQFEPEFDTVLLNPPFGTKPGNRGIDMKFLRQAVQLSKYRVYSLHKSSTRNYILRTVKSWGVDADVIAEMRYNLPKTYSFHKAKSKDVEVDLIRLTISRKAEDSSDAKDAMQKGSTQGESD